MTIPNTKSILKTKRQLSCVKRAVVIVQYFLIFRQIPFKTIGAVELKSPVLSNSTASRCSFLCRIYIIYRKQEGWMMNQMKIGAFISERRKAKGFTQSQLAEKLEITDKAVSKWETGVSQS